jgi:hypothetical protein
MIELTEEPRQAVQKHPDRPVPMKDPDTQQTFVLIRRDVYDHLLEYDDSSWTDEEMDLLAAEVDEMLDDEMAREDTEPWRSNKKMTYGRGSCIPRARLANEAPPDGGKLRSKCRWKMAKPCGTRSLNRRMMIFYDSFMPTGARKTADLTVRN